MIDKLSTLYSEIEKPLDDIETIETLRDTVETEGGVSAGDIESICNVVDVPALECFDLYSYAQSRSKLNYTLGLEAFNESVEAAKNTWVSQVGNYLTYVIKYIGEIAPRHDDRNFQRLLTRVSDVLTNALEVRQSLVSQYPGVRIDKAEQAIYNRLLQDDKLPNSQLMMDTFLYTSYIAQYETALQWKADGVMTCHYYLDIIEKVLAEDVEVDVNENGLDNIKSILEQHSINKGVLAGNKFKVDFEAYIKDVLTDAIRFDDDHTPFFNEILKTLQTFGSKVSGFKAMKREDMTATQANVMSRAMRSMNKTLYYVTQLINAIVDVFTARFNQRLCTLEYVTCTLEERYKEILRRQPTERDKIKAMLTPVWGAIREVTEDIHQ